MLVLRLLGPDNGQSLVIYCKVLSTLEQAFMEAVGCFVVLLAWLPLQGIVKRATGQNTQLGGQQPLPENGVGKVSVVFACACTHA